ncbi:DUF4214 domain-containing protein [Anabaenopsis elenkinii]|uniref:DUF4214 domain-containing protein n=1 Tax=Anabaenopsis elenkinii CCIBt3563 TaxID=2779889 RepID=A0A7S6U6H6_9CYAN|nr:DUF4214 domain-containing protein [Anabaenopsis elenkinii]QOV21727.1 DUF4214 domain-containing protein [Anabaenopsis elenkinii CCIBt3563]QOV23038.1 DUF4214 domain-containing protein [Anabaenopsis elenkinii CCIBt3563]
MTVENINNIQSLYVALLGRGAEREAFAFWTRRLNLGLSPLTTFATELTNSPAVQARIASFTPGEFIEFIYSNAFGRVADSGGKAFWVGRLGASPTVDTRAQVVRDIIASAGPADREVLNRRVETAKNETHRSLVQSLYVTLLGRAADAGGQAFWVSQLNEGKSIADITASIIGSQEAQEKYTGLINREFVELIYSNAFGRATDEGGRNFWVERINNSSRAEVVLEILEAAGADSRDREVLNNKVVVAQGLTDNFQTPFTLTTSPNENLVGTSGNDVFIGDNGNQFFATVQVGDRIDGGPGGTDTFKYYNADRVLPTLRGVENVELINARGENIDFSPAAGSGLEKVTVKFNPQGNLTVAGLRDIELDIDNVVTNRRITGNFGNGTVAAVSMTDSSTQLEIQGNRVETVNLRSESEFEDGVNRITTLPVFGPLLPNGENTSVRNINISGDARLEVTSEITLNRTAQTTVNASANSGGVELTFNNGRVNFTGSSGDDTIGFVLANFDTQDRVNGGNGTDTLVLRSDAAVVMNNTNAPLLNAVNAAQSIEILRLQGNPGGNVPTVTVDASRITAVNRYEFAANTVNLSNAAANDRFTLDGTGTLNLRGAAQASVDLTLENSPATLNLTSDRFNNATVAGRNVITRLVSDVDGLRINVLTSPTGADALGTQERALTIRGIELPEDAEDGVTIDARNFTADLNATGTALDDTFIFNAGRFFGRNGTFQGGDGTDTLELRQGAALNILADLTPTGNAQLPTNVAVINNRAQGIEILRLNGTTLTADAGQITGINRFEFVTPTAPAGDVTLRGADQNDRISLDNIGELTLEGAQQRVNLTLDQNIRNLTLVSDRNNNTSVSTTPNRIDTLEYGNEGLIINVIGSGRAADGVGDGNQDRNLIIAAPTLPENARQGITINGSGVDPLTGAAVGPAYTGQLTVTGTALNDTLTGGDGNDTFRSSAGADTLTGGGGNDTFIYTSAAHSNRVTFDIITDFTVAIPGVGGAAATRQDQINLRALNFTADDFAGLVTPAGANVADAANNAATLIGADRFGYFQLGGNTFILATNQTPDLTDDLFIRLNGPLALSTADFILAG